MNANEPTPQGATVRTLPTEPFAEGGDCPHCGALGSGIACVSNGHLHIGCVECGYAVARGSSLFRLVFETIGLYDPHAVAYTPQGSWPSFLTAWLRWWAGSSNQPFGVTGIAVRLWAVTILVAVVLACYAFPIATPLVAIALYCPPQTSRITL